MKKRIMTLALAAVLSACGTPVVTGVDDGPSTLTILHLNDTHSSFLPTLLKVHFPPDSTIYRIPAGSIARTATAVSEIRESEENVLFLHSGDMVQGTLFYTLFGGEADAAVYNAMGLDAMVTGNHEFDRGSEGLAVLLGDAEFPILCANIDVSGDALLAGLIPPSEVFGMEGGRVGVIGLTVDELANVSSPSGETTVLPVVECAQREIDRMEAEGISRIVLLTHIGYEDDLELATSLTGADIIIGGHSHSPLGDLSAIGLRSAGPYPTVVHRADGADVLVVQAGSGGTLLGRLSVSFDGDGHVTGYDGAPVLVTGGDYLDEERELLSRDQLAVLQSHIDGTPLIRSAYEDPEITELVAVYEAELAAFAYEVVGTSAEELLHQRIPGGELPQGSMIAPVICDAMLWKAGEVGLDADIALLNAGGARIPVPEGDITVGTIYTLMPFGNSLVLMEMPGEEIERVLEDALSNIFDDGNSDGSFPYTAGLRCSVNAALPEGERITSIEILGPGGWTPLDPAVDYGILTSSYLAGGGDGYESFCGVEAVDTGFIDAEVFMDYLIEIGTMFPVEPLITFTGGE